MAQGKTQFWRDWFVVAIVSVAGLIWAVSSDVFWRQDLGVYDTLIARTAPRASDDIVIVAIDDESVLRLGRFPWDRELHARLLDALARAGARTILYDVLFIEPAKGDKTLARSVNNAGPVLPLAMEIPGRDGADATVVMPIPSLHGPDVAIGHAEIFPDKDGIIRSVHLVEGLNQQHWQHVAALTACRVAATACISPVDLPGQGRVEARSFLIPFAASQHPFSSVPFSAVLDGGVPDEYFRGKVVLVGATAIGLSDVYATPLAPSRVLMPGVEVNASVVQALVAGHEIKRAPEWSAYAIALVLVCLLLVAFLLFRPLGTFLAVIILSMMAAGTSFLLWQNGIWLSPVAVLAGIAVAYPVWAARRLQVATTFMRDELDRLRRDEVIREDYSLPVTAASTSDMERLHDAISRSRDFQNFLKDILNGLPDASFVIAKDGIVLIQNAQAQLLLGDLEGDHFSTILTQLPGDHLTDHSISPENSAFPQEISDIAGRVYDVRWSHIRIMEGQGVAWVLRLADISDLRRATRQREEALQLLTHDMRSPQISILALVDRAPIQGNEKDILQRVKYYANRTLALADGFVQLARAESAHLSIEDINLADVVLDAVDDLWPQANKRSITLKTENCDQEVVIQGDRHLLTRVVINIIDNAIKYSFPGTTVECCIKGKGTNAVISICDRGPGIEVEAVGKLFDRFHQGAGGLPQGVGLGLAFARSVAERHRGTISCSARTGGGTCFNLVLPTMQEHQPIATDR
ncbi:MAG: CHASE2 domain-containing protein [Gammaproteobacteria bacterium]|nr:CHASE2 domain-containing protein [Novosphingobium sp.]MCP5143193.1 CHASE2 domain-containing protein [Gammaproteobacteria bacterium]